jgi:hypothetical protein
MSCCAHTRGQHSRHILLNDSSSIWLLTIYTASEVHMGQSSFLIFNHPHDGNSALFATMTVFENFPVPYVS